MDGAQRGTAIVSSHRPKRARPHAVKSISDLPDVKIPPRTAPADRPAPAAAAPRSARRRASCSCASRRAAGAPALRTSIRAPNASATIRPVSFGKSRKGLRAWSRRTAGRNAGDSPSISGRRGNPDRGLDLDDPDRAGIVERDQIGAPPDGSGNSLTAKKPNWCNSRVVPRATASAVCDWRRSARERGECRSMPDDARPARTNQVRNAGRLLRAGLRGSITLAVDRFTENVAHLLIKRASMTLRTRLQARDLFFRDVVHQKIGR